MVLFSWHINTFPETNFNLKPSNVGSESSLNSSTVNRTVERANSTGMVPFSSGPSVSTGQVLALLIH